MTHPLSLVFYVNYCMMSETDDVRYRQILEERVVSFNLQKKHK